MPKRGEGWRARRLSTSSGRPEPVEGRDSNASQPSRSIARRGDKPERCEGWTPGLEGPSSDSRIQATFRRFRPVDRS